MRGLAAFWAVELGADPASKVPLDGALLRDGTHADRIHVPPPVTIDDDEVALALEVVPDAVARVEELVA